MNIAAVRRSHRARTGTRIRRGWAAYAFLAPALFLLVLFLVLPVLASLYFSFTNYSVIRSVRWVGLANYQGLLHDRLFLHSLVNTAVYAAGTTFPSMAVGLLLAVLLNTKLRGLVLFRTIFYLPVLMSLIAASLVWLWLYNPQVGLFNSLLASLSISPQRWLADEHLAMPALIVMGVWKEFGYHMLLYLAGLQSISPDLYEAASLDGATPVQAFRYITLPLLRPISFFIVITSTIASFQVFGAIYVMTKGGPLDTTTTIVHQIYINAFQFSKMGYASAMAFVLFVVIVIASVVNGQFFRSDES